ncbi:MAG: peptidoglycan-binding domain-containing protein, partial [Patescibacteria group bacterium]
MSTIIQSKKTLLTVALGGAIAMVLAFGSFAASAQALTQSQIDSILGLLESFGADEATMADVEAALTGEDVSTPDDSDDDDTTTMDKFSRDLSTGSTGDDVKMLQEWLNDNGYTVATSGAGSPGNETEYFGELTRKAVAAYQAANGIEPVAGYFGPTTKSAVNAEIEADAYVPPVDDGDDDDDDD